MNKMNSKLNRRLDKVKQTHFDMKRRISQMSNSSSDIDEKYKQNILMKIMENEA